jgi:hypothetical protein
VTLPKATIAPNAKNRESDHFTTLRRGHFRKKSGRIAKKMKNVATTRKQGTTGHARHEGETSSLL